MPYGVHKITSVKFSHLLHCNHGNNGVITIWVIFSSCASGNGIQITVLKANYKLSKLLSVKSFSSSLENLDPLSTTLQWFIYSDLGYSVEC